MYLVKFRCSWADEIDNYGFKVMTKSKLDSLLLSAENYFKHNKEVEIGCGTNEAVIYYSYNDFRGDLTVSEISDNDANVLLRTFNTTSGFGFTIDEYVFTQGENNG